MKNKEQTINKELIDAEMLLSNEEFAKEAAERENKPLKEILAEALEILKKYE